MGRSIRNAGIGLLIFYLWAYLTGPLGMIVGGIAFLGGFAFGHHAGYRGAFDRMRSNYTIPTPGTGYFTTRSPNVVRIYPEEGEH